MHLRPTFLLFFGGLLLPGCVTPTETTPPLDPPVLEALRFATPITAGSELLASGVGLDRFDESARLLLRNRDGAGELEVPLVGSEGGDLVFGFGLPNLDTLGEGSFALEAVIEDLELGSTTLPIELQTARAAGLALGELPVSSAFRNDRAELTGGGFLAPAEGTVWAHFAGTFEPAFGSSRPVDVELPVLPAERFDRTRGEVVLSTALGGLAEGTFQGDLVLRSEQTSGASEESAALPVEIDFLAPALYQLSPDEVFLGQQVRVLGAGFLGDQEGDELTLLSIDGTFQGEDGATPVSLSLVPSFVAGDELSLVLRAVPSGGQLVAEDIGAARGVLRGTARPVTLSGDEELSGAATPFELTLAGVRQLVVVDFLPGFRDSLRLFGLGLAAPEVEQAVADRMIEILDVEGVEILVAEPMGWDANHYSVIEIGGPDPNGIGLFGFDNTPGKDVGNLRLFDAIGGGNYETQQDGYPGYGGVFIETLLYFSSHPELPGQTPFGAPEPEPAFDEIFDPVRASAASLDEIRGQGDGERVAQVAEAIRALAFIVAETAAHEIGHSLGLADPSGAATTFHNPGDGDGCLMDTGDARSFAERAGLVGAPETRLCYDHRDYLNSILD